MGRPTLAHKNRYSILRTKCNVYHIQIWVLVKLVEYYILHLKFFTVGWVWAISCLTIRYGLTYHSKIFSNRLSPFFLVKWFCIIPIAIILFHRFKMALMYNIYFKKWSSYFWLDDFVSAYKWSSHTCSPDQTSYCFLFDVIWTFRCIVIIMIRQKERRFDKGCSFVKNGLQL